MTPLNPFFALIIFLIAFATGYVMNKKYQLESGSDRYVTIDGLRGFLALAVFIHHANIWHDYTQGGGWHISNSKLFTQLGQTGVSFFFMISSFLFISKLIHHKEGRFSWGKFFVSRFFRLAPLYMFSLSILMFIVMQISNWSIVIPIRTFIMNFLRWFVFGIFGRPFMNKVGETPIINAGVVWSLPYEWLLYFSLPIISLFLLKKKPSILYVLLGAGFIYLFYQYSYYEWQHFYSLLGGMIAPFIIKYNKRSINFDNIYFTIITIASIIMIFQYELSANNWCKLFITISFTMIALGNSLFGLLKSKTLKFLGEISYSTYLLHGIIIFITIYYIFGMETTKALSQIEYCFLFFGITPFVIILSFLSYYFIEKPFMGLSRKYTRKKFKEIKE